MQLCGTDPFQNPTRNFYWYGHGKPAWIGSKDDIYILASEVAARLGNDSQIVSPPYSPPFLVSNRNHPYRFVFIDGCEAGESTIWAEAFGIKQKTVTFNHIRNHPERAQAFLGWVGIAANVSGLQTAEWYQTSLFWFFTLWQSGIPLNLCVKACSQTHPFDGVVLAGYFPPDNSVVLNFPLGAFPGGPPKPMNGSNARVFGYEKITRTGISQ